MNPPTQLQDGCAQSREQPVRSACLLIHPSPTQKNQIPEQRQESNTRQIRSASRFQGNACISVRCRRPPRHPAPQSKRPRRPRPTIKAQVRAVQQHALPAAAVLRPHQRRVLLGGGREEGVPAGQAGGSPASAHATRVLTRAALQCAAAAAPASTQASQLLSRKQASRQKQADVAPACVRAVPHMQAARQRAGVAPTLRHCRHTHCAAASAVIGSRSKMCSSISSGSIFSISDSSPCSRRYRPKFISRWECRR